MKKTLPLLLVLYISLNTSAQQLDSIFIKSEYAGNPTIEVLNDLERDYGIDVFFKKSWIDTLVVKNSTSGITAKEFFDQELRPSGMEFFVHGGNIIIHLSRIARIKQSLSEKSNLITIGNADSAVKDVVSVNGNISDGATKEPLIGALVEIKALNVGTVTNMDGMYSLNVPTGAYTLEVSFIGYDKKSYDVLIKSSGTFNADLFSGTMQLQELTITAEGSDFNVQNRISGVEKLGIEAIKQLPTFMGEIDPVKTLTTLPGVSTPGEASSGFNVRGGDSGENLILQDGATIYNPSHLFGFFSAFNPDLVSNVTLQKGGGPAKYGGRTSSVLNINLRHGDLQKFKLSGGIGLISSRLTAEVPIKKGKTSIIVGGRASYSDWILDRVNDVSIRNSTASFYDVNAKLYHKVSEKDQLSFSLYHSDDDFKFAADTVYAWGTKNYTLEWNHIFNQELIGSLNLSNSNYQSNVSVPEGNEAFKYANAISNISTKYNMRYTASSKHTLEFGVEGTSLLLNPGGITALEETSNIENRKINDQHGIEWAIFIDDEFDLSRKLALSMGVRFSSFLRIGADNIYKFESDEEGEVNIVDSIRYASGEIIKSFGGFEPRLSFRYLLSSTSSLKFSYYRTRQYIHLISNTVSVTPQDYWVASGEHLMPQLGDQVSVGIFKNFNKNNYEISAEGYYKISRNVVDYKEGANIFLNKALEGDLLQGDGRAYGIELFLKKNHGSLSGWIAYTYSRSLRQFKGGEGYEEVNSGAFYPSNFDIPHNLSVVMNYKLAARLVFSANFSYTSGRPVTVPVSKFSYGQILSVLNYSDRNEYRIPDYHRLDVSLTLKPGLRKDKIIEGEWVFSVFNVYGRRNAYSVFFNEYGLAHRLSILGTVFPSLSYNFKI